MPCEHKFQSYLNLERLDFKPTTLIVGTFNPLWPAKNDAQWFYGRTRRNHFWNVLPRLYGEASLADRTPMEWKAFCARHQIAITDLISCILDADQDNSTHDNILGSYSDKKISESFNEFEFTDIVSLLKNHPTIKNIYLTRGSDPFWNNLWAPVDAFVTQEERRTNKMILTPSSYARFSKAAHNRNNPDLRFNGPLNDYILERWQYHWHER